MESAAVCRSPDSRAMSFLSNGTVRMTVPPYVFSCIGIVSGAWLAARTGRRAPFIIGSAVVAILGMTHCSYLRPFLVPTAFQVISSSLQPRHVRYLYHGKPRRLILHSWGTIRGCSLLHVGRLHRRSPTCEVNLMYSLSLPFITSYDS